MVSKPPKTVFSYKPPKTADVQRIEKIYVSVAIAIVVPILLSIAVATVFLYRLSPKQEIKLFSRLFNADSYFGATKAVARSSRQAKAIDASEEYLREVLASLQARQKKFPYGKLSVHLLCNAQPNAYAVPGNMIFVTSGLLQMLESENGLAFVLGHELGHFAYRHHVKSISRYLAVGLIDLITSSSNLLEGILEASSIKFNHHQETVADRYGFKLVEAAHGHGQGADELFRHLLKSDEHAATAAFRLSHPPSAKRLGKIKQWQRKGAVAGALAELPQGLFAAACQGTGELPAEESPSAAEEG